ncbi:T9SS type A sorting domain-containing protein [Daejeonia sp. YH14]|uniref:T9SS type A sorting domain-containing protein n=1 Tax=Daejeonia sp. YH14 TaxID=3439042 RepID=UPI003F491D02
MKTKLFFKYTFLLLFLAGLQLQAQTYYFRSKASGDWKSPSTWEYSSTDGGTPISPSVLYPQNGNTAKVDVLAGHTVDITNGTYIKNTHVNSGGVLRTNFTTGGSYTIDASASANNQLVLETGGVLKLYNGLAVIASQSKKPILVKGGATISYENMGTNPDYEHYFDPYFRDISGFVIFEHNSTLEIHSSYLPKLGISYIRKSTNLPSIIPNFVIKDENALSNIGNSFTINALVKIDPSVLSLNIVSTYGTISFLHGISGHTNIVADNTTIITFGSSSIAPILDGTLSLNFFNGNLYFLNGVNILSGSSVKFQSIDPSESSQFSLAGAMNINGSVDLTNSTIEDSDGEIAVQDGGVLRSSHEEGLNGFGDTDSGSALTFSPNSTMEYYVSGDQKISGLTYGHLNLLGGGTKTFVGDSTTAEGLTTISGNTTAIVPESADEGPYKTFSANGGIKNLDNTGNKTGDLIIGNNSNLLQDINADNNYAKVQVNRNSLIKRLDYTYWSAPVSGQQLKAFSPNTLNNRFMEYTEATDLFTAVSNVNSDFVPAKGYAIRAPNNFSTTAQTFEGKFTGKPNNGDQTINLSYTPVDGNSPSTHIKAGYNLVGNPYPSNISFDQLHADNSSAIDGVAYFWTNTNEDVAAAGTGYTGENYAVYNLTGGTPATHAVGSGSTPTGIIKTGQGFMVRASGSGSLVFKNGIRSADATSHFFSKNSGNTEKDRFWLDFISPKGIVNTLLIGYVEGATDEYDTSYDAPKMALGSDSFYSMADQIKLAIQGRKIPFLTQDKIALGTVQVEAGSYTIHLNTGEGIFNGSQKIYLKDNIESKTVDLTESDYIFNADQGITEGRFEIVYRNESVLSAGNVTDKESIIVYRDGEDFVVRSYEKVDHIEIYDVSGRLLKSFNPNQKEFRIQNSGLNKGVNILRLGHNGKTTVKKIVAAF